MGWSSPSLGTNPCTNLPCYDVPSGKHTTLLKINAWDTFNSFDVWEIPMPITFKYLWQTFTYIYGKLPLFIGESTKIMSHFPVRNLLVQRRARAKLRHCRTCSLMINSFPCHRVPKKFTNHCGSRWPMTLKYKGIRVPQAH